MDREIKFRTFGKGNECMEYCTLKELANKDTFDVDFDDYEWMQFTGLLDKNRKEIYEGDILKIWVGHDEQESPYIVHDLREFFNDSNRDDSYYIITDCEIMGNIYKNPELLEEDTIE